MTTRPTLPPATAPSQLRLELDRLGHQLLETLLEGRSAFIQASVRMAIRRPGSDSTRTLFSRGPLSGVSDAALSRLVDEAIDTLSALPEVADPCTLDEAIAQLRRAVR